MKAVINLFKKMKPLDIVVTILAQLVAIASMCDLAVFQGAISRRLHIPVDVMGIIFVVAEVIFLAECAFAKERI